MTRVDPSLPLLIFDGDCGFCTTSARAAERWLQLDRVEPWQFLDLESYSLTIDDTTTAVQWVDADGSVVAAEHAVIAACRHAGGVWRLIGGTMALPGMRQLSGVMYRLIAKNRYKLPGGTPACKLPNSGGRP